MKQKQRIAVVGAGISGLASAWLLSRQHDVTLFEAGSYLGGHTNTVDVTLEGKTHPVDTGFLVFNDKTYPNLIAHVRAAGRGQRRDRDVLRRQPREPRSRMGRQQPGHRFRRRSATCCARLSGACCPTSCASTARARPGCATHPDNERSLRDFLSAGRYSPRFRRLVPAADGRRDLVLPDRPDAATMPLATFMRFCQNHGLLQVFDRPLWRTVQGGGREYVRKIAAQLDDIRLACPVQCRDARRRRPARDACRDGSEHFDQVVHGLPQRPVPGHSRLHGQRRPARRAARRHPLPAQPRRAAYRSAPAAARRKAVVGVELLCRPAATPGEQPVGVSYLINRCSRCPSKRRSSSP